MTLPVILAGICFIFILKHRWFAFLRIPLDGGITIRGRRMFGKNKTLLGPVAMAFGTALFAFALTKLFSRIGVSNLPALYDASLYGILKSCVYGALYSLFELPNSFIKRQLDIREGESGKTRIFDIADSVVGVCVGAYFLYGVSLSVVLVMGAIGIAVHTLTDMYMKSIGLKK